MFNTIKYPGEKETRKFVSGNADLAALRKDMIIEVWGWMRSVLGNRIF